MIPVGPEDQSCQGIAPTVYGFPAGEVLLRFLSDISDPFRMKERFSQKQIPIRQFFDRLRSQKVKKDLPRGISFQTQGIFQQNHLFRDFQASCKSLHLRFGRIGLSKIAQKTIFPFFQECSAKFPAIYLFHSVDERRIVSAAACVPQCVTLRTEIDLGISAGAGINDDGGLSGIYSRMSQIVVIMRFSVVPGLDKCGKTLCPADPQMIFVIRCAGAGRWGSVSFQYFRSKVKKKQHYF